MTTSPDSLSTAQLEDLRQRIKLFREDWEKFASNEVKHYLPPPHAPHRRATLLELIRIEGHLRAEAGLLPELFRRLEEFARELPCDEIPVDLLVADFQQRQRTGPPPSLELYRRRFPLQFEEFRRHINAASPSDPGSVWDRPSSSKSDFHMSIASPSQPDLANEEQKTPAQFEGTITQDPVQAIGKTASLPKQSDSAAEGNTLGFASGTLEYKLVRLLGHGMFGEVYEAVAPGGFRVAIKKMLRHVDHPATQQELSALEAIKSVSHPFLLQTQAFWIHQGHVYIVMELAEGTLGDRIKECKKQGLPGIPPEELLPYFEQAAEALDYLHGQNLSHRDVKPQNLLHLKGYCKVADFGLVRVHEHTITAANVGGTPAYMAPEAWDRQVSFRSDQYSLAATYVEARLGRKLFDSQAIHELCQQHKLETPKLSELPKAEQAVLLRALAKKPGQRFPNCKAFAKALREAIFPPPPPPSPPPSKWRTLVILGVVPMLIAMTVALTLVYFRPPDAQRTNLSVQSWCPEGWSPATDAGTATLPDGTVYHRTLTRTVEGILLRVHAIPRTANLGPQTWPVFYMLETKVSNRLFAQVWAQAEATPGSKLALARRNFGDRAARLLPGRWREGALRRDTGDSLGIDGPQADVPVVAVTMAEAAIVAAELGGDLPTHGQWLKATGMWDDRTRTSPAGDPTLLDLSPAPPRTQGIALNLLRGPWPVDRDQPDQSVFGIRQLISNGEEWTRETNSGRLLNVFELPLPEPEVLVVGQSWDSDQILTFGKFTSIRRQYPLADTDAQIGFRIVLQPETKPAIPTP